jgi:hypothetical protein
MIAVDKQQICMASQASHLIDHIDASAADRDNEPGIGRRIRRELGMGIAAALRHSFVVPRLYAEKSTGSGVLQRSTETARRCTQVGADFQNLLS